MWTCLIGDHVKWIVVHFCKKHKKTHRYEPGLSIITKMWKSKPVKMWTSHNTKYYKNNSKYVLLDMHYTFPLMDKARTDWKLHIANMFYNMYIFFFQCAYYWYFTVVCFQLFCEIHNSNSKLAKWRKCQDLVLQVLSTKDL